MFSIKDKKSFIGHEREYFKILMNMKQCLNPECNAENPTNAKFCRKCGTAFTSNRYKQLTISKLHNLFVFKKSGTNPTFTLEVFRNISFQPISLVKIRFVNRFVVLLTVLFIGILLFATTSIGENLLNELACNIDAGSWFKHYYVMLLSVVIILFCTLQILSSIYKKICFKLNTDYIEDSFCGDEIVRIARKSHLGLFDKKKNKVLLYSKYSDIEQFDKENLLVSIGSKRGLYSLKYKKIIIPAIYDSILMFTNSVITVKSNGMEYHYDVKGNKLR